ncbi:DUF4349 domain-containing protein [Eubacteriaceae bacterium ES3]|nr:DUF4349 domain-containing protein [Eubacteriaceae bacterium ES3]
MANEASPNNFFKRIKSWKYWKISLIVLASIIAVVFLLFSVIFGVFLMTGNSSGDVAYESDLIYESNEAYDSTDSSGMKETESSSTSFEDYTSSVIYAGSMRLYVENFQETEEMIIDYTNSIDGFLESSQSSYIDQEQGIENNSGSLTIRVPADKFEQVMIDLEDFGVVAYSNTSSVNITREYQDIEAQINNLKVFESRLLEYSGTAENLTDLLAIETELNRIRTEMDSLQSLINNWNTEIAYSRITISLQEQTLSTTALESPFSGLLIKIQSGFIGSINLLLGIISALIVLLSWILPFVIIIVLVIFLVRMVKKKNFKNRKMKNETVNEKKNDV